MITKPSDWLETDSRWPKWARIVAKKDINLNATGGYALGNHWVKWNESIVLEPGEYLICASMLGSRKHRDYEYALITADGTKIDNVDVAAALDDALAEGRITEKQRAAGLNSVLYSYALYIALAAE